jgi:hypothetical protein
MSKALCPAIMSHLGQEEDCVNQLRITNEDCHNLVASACGGPTSVEGNTSPQSSACLRAVAEAGYGAGARKHGPRSANGIEPFLTASAVDLA